VNEAAAAAGTVEAIEAAKAAFAAGEIKVFNTAADNFMLKDGAKIESYIADVDDMGDYVPETEVVFDGYFHESEFRSAPYFDLQLDGIELLNAKF
jgi:basic membrane protein A